ncbi:MAG: D-2-hydroxyacid dehydrogenase [Planctomycetota bacterium]
MNEETQVSVWLRHPSVECWNFRDRHRERFESNDSSMQLTVCETEKEFLTSLLHAEIALVWRFQDKWLDAAPDLRWIITPAAGRDYFHVEPRPDLELSYGAFHGEIMGETALAMMLAHCRGIIAAPGLWAKHEWPRIEIAPLMTTLRGQRLCVLGYGNIGSWVARLAAPFGVKTIGVARSARPGDEFCERVASAEELDALLPETDFLVVALPSGGSTDAIVGAEQLALLPSNAAIVNIGRGNAIDERALVEALQSNSIAAAYLDVFEEEPLPADSALRRCERAFLLPHASAMAPNYMDLFVEETLTRFRERGLARA